MSLDVTTDESLSGRKAIEMLAQRIETNKPLYKLIMLDYSMPEIDGPSTASEIRSFCEEKGVTKPYICCVTAYSENHFKKIALASGMDEFFFKPIQAH